MADNVAQKVIYKVADNMGKIGSLAFYIPTSVGTDPLVTAAGAITLFNNISNCIVVGQVSQTADDTSSGAADTNSYDIRDKLDVEYVGTQNDKHVAHIGDPDPAIFLAGSELPDPASVPWMTLKSAIEANVKDKLGNAVKVIRGYRQRSRNLKGTQRFL
jgi:hypothetical protein